MTLAEIVVSLEELEETGAYDTPSRPGNAQAYAQWLRGLSPAEILELSLQGTL